jgi:tRNA1Val (adenine37-N6)-methyltransferase
MGVFRFKQFSLDDSRCSMKIGTDAVLLGAWAPLPQEGDVLDIGCGCGVISLMIAQRNPNLRITGIDIEEAAALQASANASMSPFAPCATFQHADIRDFAQRPLPGYELIVSNPPYFQQSLKGSDPGRNCARHNITLGFNDLIAAASSLMTPAGSFSVILPHDALNSFRIQAAAGGLFPAAILTVSHLPDHKPTRALVSLTHHRTDDPVMAHLAIRTHAGDHTNEYLALIAPFYLFA